MLVELYERVPDGECTVCGTDATGSLYWTPIKDKTWETIREFMVPMFTGPDHVQNSFYLPDFSRPFCGPGCVDQKRSD
jgi:hypothetical protein